jgi:hypothetical protein
MTDIEPFVTMLGEAGTTELAREPDARGFDPNRRAARQGGTMPGNARRELEAKTGAPVLRKNDYLRLRGTVLSVEASAQTIKGKALRKGTKS